MMLSAHDKLLFIGDSVTDAGRSPVGEGLFGALGSGYVSLVDALLAVRYPEIPIRVVNKGTSGNTVRDLKARWQTDVLDEKPDWVSVMVGINDVWRQFDCPKQLEWGVPLEEYRDTLAELVGQTRHRVKGMILASPFYIEPHGGDPMRARMDGYGDVVRDIAGRNGCLFVDTQAAFLRLLAHMHSSTLAWDRVHPNTVGHMALAEAFFKVLAR